MSPHPIDRPSDSLTSDVAIVGGGLSGTLAAIVLGRAGHDVVLIDPDVGRPSDFRVEKLGADQMELLRKLQLLDAVATAAEPYDHILNYRKGRVIDETHAPHLGLRYRDFLETLRERLPENVRRITARVDTIETGNDRQHLALSAGRAVDTRLVVLATGMGDMLRRQLGIERHVLYERHSLSFGFDLRPAGGAAFRQRAMTFYGERFGDGIDYLSMFPVRSGMRANLFSFLPHTDPFVKALRADPVATLRRTMPAVEAILGPFELVGAVQSWVMDIATSRNCVRDGVVLIGDAFQTSCPAAGTGVSRLLTDVERLCNAHVPTWLSTPGMDAAKIAAYYADPQKQAMDRRAIALADYRRRLTIDPGMPWQMRRTALLVRRRTLAFADRVSPGIRATLRSIKARAA